MNKWEARGKKMEETGAKMQNLGGILTILLTVPIALTIFFGPVIGIGVSAVVTMLYVVGKRTSK